MQEQIVNNSHKGIDLDEEMSHEFCIAILNVVNGVVYDTLCLLWKILQTT